MIIPCPQCQKKLRIDATKYAGRKLSLTCRGCGNSFPVSLPSAVKLLVAHGEPEVCRTILEICQQDVGDLLTCSDAAMARQLLSRHNFSVLLLDVALPGAFPFQLIDEVHRSGESMKIVLLPSVFNRTAYKRKPSSLYGADGYLELHHLNDRLIPLLHELVPQLTLKSQPSNRPGGTGEERSLASQDDPQRQAEELARQLIADITLYHQEQVDLGITSGDLETRLAPQLLEARRLMACRLPEEILGRQDHLLLALKRFAAARQRELRATGQDVHG